MERGAPGKNVVVPVGDGSRAGCVAWLGILPITVECELCGAAAGREYRGVRDWNADALTIVCGGRNRRTGGERAGTVWTGIHSAGAMDSNRDDWKHLADWRVGGVV